MLHLFLGFELLSGCRDHRRHEDHDHRRLSGHVHHLCDACHHGLHDLRLHRGDDHHEDGLACLRLRFHGLRLRD
jgi:hypothetical protein